MDAIEAVTRAVDAYLAENAGVGYDADEITRAAVAALAGQGDITDEQAHAAIFHALRSLDCVCAVDPVDPEDCSSVADALVPTFRVLLARQAAVHAARIERLERWKAEATDTLLRWEAAWRALPQAVREDPSVLGRRKPDVVADYLAAHATEKVRILSDVRFLSVGPAIGTPADGVQPLEPATGSEDA